jgi:acetoin utilization deacetylase AcuC-like enzyme
MLPFRLVYSDAYDLNLGQHVFPTEKYRLIHDRLLSDGFAAAEDFIAPEPASDEQILLVHRPEWVNKLKTGSLTYFDIMKLEIPYSEQMVKAFWLATGGTILASRNALRDRIGFNIGGGYHHAFAGHGEGFCAIHDVAVAIRVLQKEGAIERAMVVDCDVHHGNGTAGIFAGDASVMTLSIHQFENYPTEKPPSTIDINLPDGVGDEEYLHELKEDLVPSMSGFRPDLLMYIAGADPYREDQLGGLALTVEGLKARDRFVLETALGSSIPVSVALAGGYARNTGDTVTIHCNTAKVAEEILR